MGCRHRLQQQVKCLQAGSAALHIREEGESQQNGLCGRSKRKKTIHQKSLQVYTATRSIQSVAIYLSVATSQRLGSRLSLYPYSTSTVNQSSPLWPFMRRYEPSTRFRPQQMYPQLTSGQQRQNNNLAYDMASMMQNKKRASSKPARDSTGVSIA